jgi:3'(2'), 5'-bisphosphate nucleotidase
MAMSMRDDELASELATAAGRLLLELRRKLTEATESERRHEGDRQSQAFLAGKLHHARPLDAVLSEESLDDHRRLRSPRVWIIDPLDGTREFGELERKDWAVHVALWAGGLVAGAVALPAQGVTLSMHTAVATAPPPRRPRVVVSRTRPPALATFVAEALGGELTSMGSAGAKVAAIVQGAADVYVHAGGQYEWDSAAPVAVALAAGLHASRIDGSTLEYNRPDPLLPDLLVCRPELAARVLAAIREWSQPSAGTP